MTALTTAPPCHHQKNFPLPCNKYASAGMPVTLCGVTDRNCTRKFPSTEGFLQSYAGEKELTLALFHLLYSLIYKYEIMLTYTSEL